MIIVGSMVLKLNLPHTENDLYREPNDTDYLCTEYEWELMVNHFKQIGCKIIERNGNKGHIQKDNGYHLEFEIAGEDDSTKDLLDYCNNKEGIQFAEPAPMEVLLLLKMSHRFKKNSPHFWKTMADIHFIRGKGVSIPEELNDILVKREKETYNYAHPKLNVNRKSFFTGDVPYTYDHDSLHEAIAILGKPAYTNYIVEGEEVLTSKEKFFAQSDMVKLLGVYEESCVLALERSQVPFDFEIEPKTSFMTALQKVCTSITSGYFRSYAWENAYTVIGIYNKLGESDYIKRFKENQHMLRPFEG